MWAPLVPNLCHHLGNHKWNHWPTLCVHQPGLQLSVGEGCAPLCVGNNGVLGGGEGLNQTQTDRGGRGSSEEGRRTHKCNTVSHWFGDSLSYCVWQHQCLQCRDRGINDNTNFAHFHNSKFCPERLGWCLCQRNIRHADYSSAPFRPEWPLSLKSWVYLSQNHSQRMFHENVHKIFGGFQNLNLAFCEVPLCMFGRLMGGAGDKILLQDLVKVDFLHCTNL